MAEDRKSVKIQVSGKEQFRNLARRLKDAPEEIRKAFLSAAGRTFGSLKDEVSQLALRILPKRGGLARRVAESRFSERVGQSSESLTITSPYAIGKIDNGTVRHPVFGNRQRWVEEVVTPGFWSIPVAAYKPQIISDVQDAMDEVAKKIENG